jgi:signal transduction histidine kinase
MSQSSSVHAAAPGSSPARGGTGPALALRNWRVASRLMVLVAIPVVLGLALAGLRITDTTRSATAYGQVSRLAGVGRQVTGLAQAVENERAGTAAFVAQGRPAAGRLALQRQYVITDRWAATVRGLLPQLDRGYPAQTRASAATVLASIAELPGLRRQAAQPQVPALAVINGYSAATAGLFAINDGIADLSGNSELITSVRALGALSRMTDQAALQQAILNAALLQGHVDPGTLTALTSAQARQASELGSFRGAATPEQSWALTTTLASAEATQARAVEQRAIAAGAGPLALGGAASQQWRTGMSYTVGWMRHSEQQLTDWITGYAQGLQRSATWDAIITGGAALAALALILLVALIITRSLVRPLRRLEAAALDVAGARLPATARALSVAAEPDHAAWVSPVDVRSTDEIGRVARAFDQVQQEAVRLAAEQAQQRAGLSALSARFFRRSYVLQERLLRLIDSLEFTETDPDRLASVFQLDHLATRLRRHSDSALVLAGHQTAGDPAGPFSLVDVLRAALSEIEQYDRVALHVQQDVSVSGNAAADAVHLLAELLENATTFSAPETQVIVSGQLVRGGGVLITITNRGTGLSTEQLRQLNRQLAHPPTADAAVARQVGLFAVAHLAARHGITVRLRRPPDGGTTAEVDVPAALISRDGTPGSWLSQTGPVPQPAAGKAGAKADGQATAGTKAGVRATAETKAGSSTATGAKADAATATPDVPFSALRFAAGPMSPRAPETSIRETVPLHAPAPPPAAGPSPADRERETGRA